MTEEESNTTTGNTKPTKETQKEFHVILKDQKSGERTVSASGPQEGPKEVKRKPPEE
jgi:hypothetical protein